MSSCVIVILWEPPVQVCLGCIHLFFLCSCWMDGGQWERESCRAHRCVVCTPGAQGCLCRSLSLVRRALCTPVAALFALTPRMLSPSTTHLSPSPSSSSPLAPPTSSPFLPPPLFFVCVILLRHWQLWDEPFSFLFFTLLFLFYCWFWQRRAPGSSWNWAAPHSLSVIFFFFFSSLCTQHQMCELWGATACLLSFTLTWFHHHMHDFFSIFPPLWLSFPFFLKKLIHFPLYLSVEHTKPLMKTLVKAHWKGRERSWLNSRPSEEKKNLKEALCAH